MYTVNETPVFIEWAAKVWGNDEREEFINWIAQNADAGDVIPSTGGLRKVRWTRAGMGKRGGVRVVYYKRDARGDVVLLIVYAKAKFDNLSADLLTKLKERFQ